MKEKPLATVAERYVRQRVNMRPTSAAQIAHSVAALNRHAGRAVRLRDCTADFLCGFLTERLAKCSKSTAKRDRGNLITVLRFAKAQGWIRELPEVPTIRLERRLPRAWTLKEVEALLRASSALSGNMRHLPIRRSWFFSSLLLFLYESGLRVSSAVSLQTHDVWIDRRCALLRADTDKTWSDQVVHLSKRLAELLKEGMDPKRRLVWEYPYDKRKLWIHLAEIRELAGLPQGREFGFHRMRKTHATQVVIAAGWEAARRSLGHSSETMTRRYVDLTQVSQNGHVELQSPKF